MKPTPGYLVKGMLRPLTGAEVNCLLALLEGPPESAKQDGKPVAPRAWLQEGSYIWRLPNSVGRYQLAGPGVIQSLTRIGLLRTKVIKGTGKYAELTASGRNAATWIKAAKTAAQAVGG